MEDEAGMIHPLFQGREQLDSKESILMAEPMVN